MESKPLTHLSSIDSPYARCNDVNKDGFTLHHPDDSSVCIKISTEAVPYDEAKEACQAYPNGRLFVSDSLEKISLITVDGVFVGLSDAITEDMWVWADGRGMTQNERTGLFADGEPNNNRNEDCAALLDIYDTQLTDMQCSIRQRYVCEIPLGKLCASKFSFYLG